MSPIGIFLTYVIVWTVLFFMALPLGVSIPPRTSQGLASSAPLNPQIGKKMGIVSLVSLLIVGLLVWGVKKTDFPLRDYLTS